MFQSEAAAGAAQARHRRCDTPMPRTPQGVRRVSLPARGQPFGGWPPTGAEHPRRAADNRCDGTGHGTRPPQVSRARGSVHPRQPGPRRPSDGGCGGAPGEPALHRLGVDACGHRDGVKVDSRSRHRCPQSLVSHSRPRVVLRNVASISRRLSVGTGVLAFAPERDAPHHVIAPAPGGAQSTCERALFRVGDA